MRFLSYVVKRLAYLGLVLLGVSVVVFFLLRGMPGVDPLAAYITPGLPISQEALSALRRELRLDEPLPVQYVYYVGGLLRGDWGYSRTAAQPVLDALLGRLPATIELAVFAVLLSTGFGVPAGVVAALRKDRTPDVAVRVLSITGISFPVFWLGIILQLVFFYYLGQLGLPTLPSRGRVGDLVALQYPVAPLSGFYLVDSLIRGNLPFFGSAVRHLVLPALTLSLISLASIVRIMRASMLEVLRQDYILLARSKGLPARVVIVRHALRNAITPVLTTAGTTLGILLGGAVVVETVFSWPGIGRLAAQGILNNDSVLVVGFTLFVATMMVLVNLVVDLLYAVVDPRVRY
ncbi:MAG TPA: ABC transporter permease [Candidatus Bathyarchaeia archaeon]|nr:ABC transporter permease [Candidatus Bathyarchaeia archaeon]